MGQVKEIYALPQGNKKKIKVTMDDLKDLDDDRWVEIPDDYLKTPLEGLIETKKSKKHEFIIVVERKQEDEDNPWPRAVGDDWRDNLKTGDILDCKDDQDKWYESVVRRVYPKGHKDLGKICVHNIGWNVKWDENVEIADTEYVRKRHTETFGPHRPRAKKRGYAAYTVSSQT